MNYVAVYTLYSQVLIVYSQLPSFLLRIISFFVTRWRQLNSTEKRPYVEEAKRLHELHKIEFPGYKYKPKKKKELTPRTGGNVVLGGVRDFSAANKNLFCKQPLEKSYSHKLVDGCALKSFNDDLLRKNVCGEKILRGKCRQELQNNTKNDKNIEKSTYINEYKENKNKYSTTTKNTETIDKNFLIDSPIKEIIQTHPSKFNSSIFPQTSPYSYNQSEHQQSKYFYSYHDDFVSKISEDEKKYIDLYETGNRKSNFKEDTNKIPEYLTFDQDIVNFSDPYSDIEGRTNLKGNFPNNRLVYHIDQAPHNQLYNYNNYHIDCSYNRHNTHSTISDLPHSALYNEYTLNDQTKNKTYSNYYGFNKNCEEISGYHTTPFNVENTFLTQYCDYPLIRPELWNIPASNDMYIHDANNSQLISQPANENRDCMGDNDGEDFCCIDKIEDTYKNDCGLVTKNSKSSFFTF